MTLRSDDALRVGLVGCGTISTVYLEAGQRFDDLEVVACTDADVARATSTATRFGLRAYDTVEDLLEDPDVELVLNLTPPKAHDLVSTAALLAGKHVYSEKPLATSCAKAAAVLELANGKGLLVGCAPDTFLGAGLQTCRQLIDDGAIGTPVAATAFALGHGPDNWHQDPQFFYEDGAGPLLDVGPYYVTALVHLLGPVQAVTGSARISFVERLVTGGPREGTVLHVATPTHVTGSLELASGALVTLAASFDVWASEHPRIEIYGSEGMLSVPDPNRFGGPVRLWRDGAFVEVELERPYAEQSRGIGLADLAAARAEGRLARANGSLGFHVLEVLESVLVSASEGTRRTIASTVDRPAPLPANLREGATIAS